MHDALEAIGDEPLVLTFQEMDVNLQLFGDWQGLWHDSLAKDATDLDVIAVLNIELCGHKLACFGLISIFEF